MAENLSLEEKIIKRKINLEKADEFADRHFGNSDSRFFRAKAIAKGLMPGYGDYLIMQSMYLGGKASNMSLGHSLAFGIVAIALKYLLYAECDYLIIQSSS